MDWLHDQWILEDPEAPDEQREQALDRLLELIPWSLNANYAREREALTILKWRARLEGKPLRSLQEEYLRSAISLVVLTRREVHRHYGKGFGSSPLRYDDTAPVGVRLLDLPIGIYLAVFQRAVESVALDLVLDEEPFVLRGRTDGEDGDRSVGLRRRPTAELLDPEEWATRIGEQDPLPALLARLDVEELFLLASPRQAEICEDLMAGETVAASARARGMSVGAAGAQLTRLRDKVRKAM